MSDITHQSSANIGNLLPVPDDYMVSEAVAWAAAGPAYALAAALIPYVLYRLVAKRDVVPLLIYLGGAIATLNEPTLNLNIHLWHAQNMPGFAFQMYGIRIGLFVVCMYIVFVGMLGYFWYRMMARPKGLTIKQIFLWWFGIGTFEGLMELWAMWGAEEPVHTYYGFHPLAVFDIFPAWMFWTNSTGILVVGFFLWLFIPLLQGWKKVVLLLFPALAFSGVYGAVAWPNYAAVNFDGPSAIGPIGQNLLSGFSAILCLIIVYAVALFVAKDTPLRGTGLP